VEKGLPCKTEVNMYIPMSKMQKQVLNPKPQIPNCPHCRSRSALFFLDTHFGECTYRALCMVLQKKKYATPHTHCCILDLRKYMLTDTN
jgi:hypothetical protein